LYDAACGMESAETGFAGVVLGKQFEHGEDCTLAVSAGAASHEFRMRCKGRD
jgi:hypothetical protein